MKSEDYVKSEGLDKLIDFDEYSDYEIGVFDSVSGDLNIPIAPQIDDLVRLHRIIRNRKCFTVLEFGSGYSSVIIADALKKNKDEWQKLPEKPQIRNRFMHQLFSVDASKKWIGISKKRIPNYLNEIVNFHYSPVKIGTFNGQICHYYENLPDIIPDFIYVDGPSPKDVKGNMNGLSFQCDERTVISGDLLLMESTFLPGTYILIDGRTNNARFLEKNFKRDYEYKWDKKGDVTTFELIEDILGEYNLISYDLY